MDDFKRNSVRCAARLDQLSAQLYENLDELVAADHTSWTLFFDDLHIATHSELDTLDSFWNNLPGNMKMVILRFAYLGISKYALDGAKDSFENELPPGNSDS